LNPAMLTRLCVTASKILGIVMHKFDEAEKNKEEYYRKCLMQLYLLNFDL